MSIFEHIIRHSWYLIAAKYRKLCLSPQSLRSLWYDESTTNSTMLRNSTSMFIDNRCFLSQLSMSVSIINTNSAMVDDHSVNISRINNSYSLFEVNCFTTNKFVKFLVKNKSSFVDLLILESAKLLLTFAPVVCLALALIAMVLTMIILGSYLRRNQYEEFDIRLPSDNFASLPNAPPTVNLYRLKAFFQNYKSIVFLL